MEDGGYQQQQQEQQLKWRSCCRGERRGACLNEPDECNSNNNNNDPPPPLYLSEHTISLRKAYRHCADLFQRQVKPRLVAAAVAVAVDTEPELLSVGDNNNNDTSILIVGAVVTAIIPQKKAKLKAAKQESDSHSQRRHEAYRTFWERQSSSSSSSLEPTIVPTTTITVDTTFQRDILHSNLPCLIAAAAAATTNLQRQQQQQEQQQQQQQHNFGYVDENWRQKVDDDNGSHQRIHRQWFLDTLGEDCLVPLRYNNTQEEEVKGSLQLASQQQQLHQELDDEGRAQECQTKHVTMKEWIQLLEELEEQEGTVHSDGNKKHPNNNNKPTTTYSYYLKDWHLQQHLEQLQKQYGHAHDDDGATTTTPSTTTMLYSCPPLFSHDLLNTFLRQFTKGSDYRFCYWGPSQSSTARHADVLHSLSWSYNVHGTKQWTFYCHHPSNTTTTTDNINNNNNDNKSLTVIQRTGEIMVVPATWQHTVVNLEETISINHNWITTSNLDLTWQCLLVEMDSIRDELLQWQPQQRQQPSLQTTTLGKNVTATASADDTLDMESCENMLRGCVGLDVSSFLFMMLLRLLEIAQKVLEGAERNQKNNNDEGEDVVVEDDNNGDGDHLDMLYFDLFRLTAVLKNVVTTTTTATATDSENEQGSTDNSSSSNIMKTQIHLRERLVAMLQSDSMAKESMAMAQFLIDWVDQLLLP